MLHSTAWPGHDVTRPLPQVCNLLKSTSLSFLHPPPSNKVLFINMDMVPGMARCIHHWSAPKIFRRVISSARAEGAQGNCDTKWLMF